MASLLASSIRSSHQHQHQQDELAATGGIDHLANMDFSSIEELDPSLADGYRVIYDREVSLEVRVQESVDGPQHIGTLEAFKVKILLLGEDESPQVVRVELSSEADLFFHYVHDLDETGFAVMQDQQRLMVEFPEYPNVLIKMLNDSITDPASHLAVFVLLPDTTAKVDFIKNMEFKFVELMSLTFARSAEDTVQQHITYRYNAIKGRMSLLQSRLSDLNNLIAQKNPSLLRQLQRAPNITLTNGAMSKTMPASTYHRTGGDAY